MTNGVDYISTWCFKETQRRVGFEPATCSHETQRLRMTNSVDYVSMWCFKKSQGFESTTWLLSIDIFKGTLDRRAHMKLRGSEWQTVWIVFRRDASERGREESRRVTNDCMPLVARPQISHPMTDVSKAKTWNSFDFFLYHRLDKYRRWRWGAKKYS